ncbi:MAG TPA: type II toxin-antitoxin system RelE/ParE family toxin [Lamprocystis sp. (in: g-proteobacteria)]|nr:type II toxin-antitoxin system RelE/ParE family toxin [Lamprocystis sp. (in: g-proteobacteria)]
MELLHYLTRDGRDLYQEWLDDLRDTRARVAIDRRVERLAGGNPGDRKFCREGVWELRIDSSPGYRVYFAPAGQAQVVLLCGGDKGSQSSDLDQAVICWRDWQRRD